MFGGTGKDHRDGMEQVSSTPLIPLTPTFGNIMSRFSEKIFRTVIKLYEGDYDVYFYLCLWLYLGELLNSRVMLMIGISVWMGCKAKVFTFLFLAILRFPLRKTPQPRLAYNLLMEQE